MGKYESVEFCGELRHETDNAYLVYAGAKRVGSPKANAKRQDKLAGSEVVIGSLLFLNG